MEDQVNVVGGRPGDAERPQESGVAALGHRSQEIAVAALLQQFDQRHSVVGNRVLGAGWWASQSTVAHLSDEHLAARVQFPPSPYATRHSHTGPFKDA